MGELAEEFEATEPDADYRGPASIGKMLRISLMIGLGAFLLFLLLGFAAMYCGGPEGCAPWK
jgi:hypothetical protein